MQMTTHAHHRIAQRVAPTAHAPTLARLAYLNGIGYKRYPFWLKRYVIDMNRRHGKSQYKLYGDNLYIYKPNKKEVSCLVTVMPFHYAIRSSKHRGFIKSHI